jgi:hypothetical protein
VTSGKTMVLEALPIGEIETLPDEEPAREAVPAGEREAALGGTGTFDGDMAGSAPGIAEAGATDDPEATANGGGNAAGADWWRSG